MLTYDDNELNSILLLELKQHHPNIVIISSKNVKFTEIKAKFVIHHPTFI